MKDQQVHHFNHNGQQVDQTWSEKPALRDMTMAHRLPAVDMEVT